MRLGMRGLALTYFSFFCCAGDDDLARPGKQFRAPGSNACLAAARTVVLYGHDLHY